MADCSVTGSAYFEDARHLNNFLNYLFRTDLAQKWTNAQTQFNREWFAGCSQYPFGTDVDARVKYKKNKCKEIANEFGVKQLKDVDSDRYENFIVYFDDLNDIYEVVETILEAFDKTDRWMLDTIVSHLDQNDNWHFHVVGHLADGVVKQENEELSDIMFDE